jgi:hypothetical protein
MSHDEIQIGKTYVAKFGRNEVPVRIEKPDGQGYIATATKTGKRIVITSAKLLRYEVVQAAPAPTLATPAKKACTPKPSIAVKKLSALDAAAKVLAETGQTMSCQELIAAMAAKGYWTSPAGRTPHATLYAAVLRELQAKGTSARFVKVGPGRFAANRGG